MSTAFSRLANKIAEAAAYYGLIIRKTKRSNVRNDPSITAADGEPSDDADVEPNASIRLVGDATDPDRVLAVRVGGVWYYAQMAAESDTALLDSHLDGGGGQHDATEIDYERADGSKKNIAAGSDTVEAALTDLDDATGGLASLTTAVKTSVVAAINEVDANADAAQADATQALADAATALAAANEADDTADAARAVADAAIPTSSIVSGSTIINSGTSQVSVAVGGGYDGKFAWAVLAEAEPGVAVSSCEPIGGGNLLIKLTAVTTADRDVRYWIDAR